VGYFESSDAKLKINFYSAKKTEIFFKNDDKISLVA
jgi:hypothetical protein